MLSEDQQMKHYIDLYAWVFKKLLSFLVGQKYQLISYCFHYEVGLKHNESIVVRLLAALMDVQESTWLNLDFLVIVPIGLKGVTAKIIFINPNLKVADLECSSFFKGLRIFRTSAFL
ncbi:unnamed protein product [Amaranthus hypochondriacus]